MLCICIHSVTWQTQCVVTIVICINDNMKWRVRQGTAYVVKMCERIRYIVCQVACTSSQHNVNIADKIVDKWCCCHEGVRSHCLHRCMIWFTYNWIQQGMGTFVTKKDLTEHDTTHCHHDKYYAYAEHGKAVHCATRQLEHLDLCCAQGDTLIQSFWFVHNLFVAYTDNHIFHVHRATIVLYILLLYTCALQSNRLHTCVKYYEFIQNRKRTSKMLTLQ